MQMVNYECEWKLFHKKPAENLALGQRHDKNEKIIYGKLFALKRL